VKSLVTGLPPDLRFRAKGTYDQPAPVARMLGSMSGVPDPRARSFLVTMFPWNEP
jgi:hypothetical protein